MSCGTLLSCPTCMGYEFSLEEKVGLRRGGGIRDNGLQKELIQARCNRIDARRAELGYSPVIWVY